MSDSDYPWVDAKDWKTVWETINTLPGGGKGDAFRARRRADGIIGFLKTIESRKDPERRGRLRGVISRFWTLSMIRPNQNGASYGGLLDISCRTGELATP
ncbi:hypothetical protein [Acetobacter aceti]|uniref:Uncharacterized protein n=1 Tax=Acetobacter aceti TaxID=435 RepID=A0A6S6PVR6_ACEAC|nr:hypothetical protein [Acetobacter aceti]BCI68732.1 hypothetical protein AAJCM20276_33560 [Acetobacter aceti]